jgi:hypothetical protein
MIFSGVSALRRLFIYSLITAVVILAGAGIYFQYIEPNILGSTSIPLKLQPKLVETVSVQGRHGEFLLNREDGWVVSVHQDGKDLLVRADTTKVATLFHDLFNMKPRAAVYGYSPQQQSDYGFNQPVAELVLSEGERGKGRSTRIVFGPREDHVGLYAWLSSKAHRLYRVDDFLLEHVSRPFSFYYDKRVLPFDISSVERFQLTQKYAGGWTVVRDKEGFVFETPAYLKGRRASNSEVRFYLLMLAGLKADSFVSVGTELPGEPEAALRVWFDSKSSIRMDIYKNLPFVGGGFTARSSFQPEAFRLDDVSVRQLLKTPFDIQGRNVVDLDIGKVASIKVLDPNQALTVSKIADGWFFGDTEKRVTGIDMSLWRFKELKFEALPLTALPQTASWLMTCEFRDAEGNRLAALKFFSDSSLPPGQSWVKNGGDLYYPVASQIMNDLRGLLPGKSMK